MDQRDGFEYVPDPLGRLGRGEWRRRKERDPFGRLPAAPRIDFAELFALSAAVGRGRPNLRNDVAKLEGLLAVADRDPALVRRGPTGQFDDAVEAALARYQRTRGLSADGWLRPDGETMRSLGPEVRRVAARRLVRIPPPEPEAAAQFHREMDREEADPFWAAPDPLWRQFLSALGIAVLGPSWPPEKVPQVGGVRG